MENTQFLGIGRYFVRILRTLLMICAVSCLFGCYAGITGRVIDAETKKPIEGAVVLVEWTITRGYGLSYNETYDVYEGVTNSDGEITLPGVYRPHVHAPDVTVYKQGYVAWNSKLIFSNIYSKRTDFDWKNGYAFLLEKFKSEYTYLKHYSFVDSCIGHSFLDQKRQIIKAMQFERSESIKEDNEIIRQWKENQRKSGGNP